MLMRRPAARNSLVYAHNSRIVACCLTIPESIQNNWDFSLRVGIRSPLRGLWKKWSQVPMLCSCICLLVNYYIHVV